MTDPFDEDLEAIFEERAADFSEDLRDRLRQLWRQGVLEGRALERALPSLDLSNSWYDPNLHALVVPMSAPFVRVENGFFSWMQAVQTKEARDESQYVSWFGSTSELQPLEEKPPKDLLGDLVVNSNQDAWLGHELQHEIRNFTQSLYSAPFLKEYNNEWFQKLEQSWLSSTTPSKKGT